MISLCGLVCVWLYKWLISSPWFHRSLDLDAGSEMADVVARHEEAIDRWEQFDVQQRTAAERAQRDLETVRRTIGKNQ